MSEPIGLFDMDGTLCDYDGQMREDLAKIAGPNDPDFNVANLHGPEVPDYIEQRMRFIKNSENWWLNLPKLQLGFDVLKMAVYLDFEIHILTKGPRATTQAWSQKVDWIREKVPDSFKYEHNLFGLNYERCEKETHINMTITEDKGLVYGKVLVDDYPPYVERWLSKRPRGLVIMPAHLWNEGFEHPNVVRYDGENKSEVFEALKYAKNR